MTKFDDYYYNPGTGPVERNLIDLEIGMAFGWCCEKSLGCGILLLIMGWEDYLSDEDAEDADSFDTHWQKWREIVYG
jgi:hypothetical protein